MLRTAPRQHSYGFTLIEMIVSLGVFSVIVTMSVGSLLALIAGNQRLQGEQSIMTNLSFALDSMTREIRTGYFYVCAGVSNANVSVTDLEPNVNPPPKIFADGDDHERLDKSTKDCASGRGSNDKLQGISFWEGGNSIVGMGSDKRIMYYYDSEKASIMRRVGNNGAQPVVSSGLKIVDANFYVTGSERLEVSNSNTTQPTVTIYVKAVATDDYSAYQSDHSSVKTYQLETTVTQRILDL